MFKTTISTIMRTLILSVVILSLSTSAPDAPGSIMFAIIIIGYIWVFTPMYEMFTGAKNV